MGAGWSGSVPDVAMGRRTSGRSAVTRPPDIGQTRILARHFRDLNGDRLMSENVELARKVYETFAKGDIESVIAMLDPAIEWRKAAGNPYQPNGAPWIGPQAVVENLFVR